MDQIPVYTFEDLADSLKAKVSTLCAGFESSYRSPPQFVARVPGR